MRRSFAARRYDVMMGLLFSLMVKAVVWSNLGMFDRRSDFPAGLSAMIRGLPPSKDMRVVDYSADNFDQVLSEFFSAA